MRGGNGPTGTERRLEQLVPEFKEVREITAPPSYAKGLVKRRRLSQETRWAGTALPKDAQIISFSTRGIPSEGYDVKVGIPWEMLEFFERAKNLAHPFASFTLPGEIAEAIRECAVLGVDAIVRKRRE